MNMCSPEWWGTLWWAAGKRAKWHLQLVIHSHITPSIQNRTESSFRDTSWWLSSKLSSAFSFSCCCFVWHVSGPCNVRSKHLLTHRLSRHWRTMAIVSVSLKLLDLGPVLWFLTLSWLKLHFTNAGIFSRNCNLVWHRHFDFNEAKRKKCWYLLRKVEPKLRVIRSFAVIHHNSISFYSVLIVLSENEWVLLLLFPIEVIFPHDFHGPMLLSPVLILLGIENIKPSKWYLGKEIGLESNPDLCKVIVVSCWSMYPRGSWVISIHGDVWNSAGYTAISFHFESNFEVGLGQMISRNPFKCEPVWFYCPTCMALWSVQLSNHSELTA